MPPGPRNGRSRRDDLRARSGIGDVFVPQRYGEIVPVAEVSHRRDARPQMLESMATHPCRDRRVVLIHDLLMLRWAVRVKGEVHVSVDQSREQGHIAEVQHLQVSRSGGCGAIDSRNAGAVDDHQREALVQGFAVVDPGGPDCPCPPVSHKASLSGFPRRLGGW